MVRLYLPTFIFDVVHQSSQHLFFDYFLKALTLFVKKTLQALCFVVVVKLKKQYKMIASVVSCQLVRDWTASRDALIRTFLSAFCLALLPTESKTYVRPLIAFHRHGKTINLVTGNLNLPLISTLPVVWPQRGASFCYWLVLYAFPTSDTRPAQKKWYKKTPGQLIFQLAKLFLSLYT